MEKHLIKELNILSGSELDVEVKHIDEYKGRGVVSTKACLPLLRIPYKLMIGPQMFDEIFPQWRDHECFADDPTAAMRRKIILLLLYAQGPFVSEKVPLESFIRAYVLGLPRKSYFYSMPVTWFEDQQRLCGPLSLLEVLCQKMRAQIDEAEFRLRGLVKANPKFFGYTRFGIEFCEWCYCVIYSRGLMVRGPDGIAIPILPPLFDLVNHSDDPNCFLESSVLDADDSRGVVSTDSGLYIVNPNGSVVRPDGGVIMSGPGQPLIVPLDGKLVIGQDKKVIGRSARERS